MTTVNDLSFTHLITLVAVFETGEFTAAADELGIAQSTVSKRIATMESAFGLQLFIRRAKSELLPTPAGRRLYDSAASVLQQWSDAVYHMAPSNFQKTPFTLMLSHTASSTLLPRVIAGMHRLLDTMDFSAHTMNSEQIIEGIIKKHAQMGIIEKPVDTETVQLDVLCEDQLVLAVNAPQDHELSAEQHETQHNMVLTPDNSSSIPSDALWLLREPGSGVRYFTDMFFRTFGLSPSRVVELDSNEKICSVLASGIGCTVLSSQSAPNGVPIFNLGDSFVRHFFAVTPKTGLNPDQRIIAQKIIEILR
ncbi:LysR family transcriptional regulator [Bifidobacterium sp.]|jgi:DNA-binding transcriptional LysR family regulator|uniref:LysR family transcriptional regulator n=1 Tax=Bifidobacterium sp. TaxID=41200 RepID=UPI0025B81DFA|nr:LysR family transcriptional regulator [Bifidobacterium sp.]MCH4159862.1 LysR family transcriptional regulator [Bifidobacterium sp.]MCH4175054.1 LysR family transcriptional regulator [Bifidobacterium sp.]MCI1636385.1 LysR family transcriptional regulator [Bifidobacterium sp.]